MDAVAEDTEILMLSHQLSLLRRQVARPRFSWSDPGFIATLASRLAQFDDLPFSG